MATQQEEEPKRVSAPGKLEAVRRLTAQGPARAARLNGSRPCRARAS